MRARAGMAALALAIGLAPSTVGAQLLTANEAAPLPLVDVLALARPYPNLVQEIRLALIRAGLQRDDVVCTARRHQATWRGLEGERLAPYACRIGDRTVEIAARQTYYDANGHRLERNDPRLHERATRLAESGLTWRWQFR